jgi:hypothetical protein
MQKSEVSLLVKSRLIRVLLQFSFEPQLLEQVAEARG